MLPTRSWYVTCFNYSSIPPHGTNTSGQALPLSAEVKHLNAYGVLALAQDVQYLTEFVDSLENGQMLRENLDELQQTINLLQSDNHEEFFDISVRNKKYGRVDALNGPALLEKYFPPLPPPQKR